MTLWPPRRENGHSFETRRECTGCLGYLVTRPLARDRGILSVVALVRPLAYFDSENGGVLDEVHFFSARRRTETWDHGNNGRQGSSAPDRRTHPRSVRNESAKDGMVGFEPRHATTGGIRRIDAGGGIVEARL